ncbi:MAG: hypothetical protein C0501_17455 [Isosphaera sp.]|nr:hypothetical protein [Isosphaera sp.]
MPQPTPPAPGSPVLPPPVDKPLDGRELAAARAAIDLARAYASVNTVVEGWLESPTQRRPDIGPQMPTVYSHGDGSYSCDRANPYRVTDEEDAVLKAFLDTNKAMETRHLVDASGVTNVARVVGGLIERYEGRFAAAIRKPEKKGMGGYYIRVRPAEPGL